jgi:hypothetical protein
VDDDGDTCAAAGALGDRQRHDQHPGLVLRGGGARVDAVVEGYVALERPVLDLGLLVDLARDAGARARAGDRQLAVGEDDLDRGRVDTGKAGDDDELRRLLGGEAVDRGAEAAPEPGEAGYLPEICEQLLDLPMQAVDVSPRHRAEVTPPVTIERMALVRRVLKLAAAALAFFAYVWYAAVRHTPAVKRRKAVRRALRRS